jgi:DUF1365 family protein
VFLDQLRDRGGDLVNISSVAGRVAPAGFAAYAATKWGINAIERHYHWTASTPGPTLSVHIENRRGDGVVEFDATLNLRRHALTRTALRAFLARPAEAARVLALIYGHALTLALRGAARVSHQTTRAR